MPISQQQSKAAFNRIMDEVLRQGDGTPLKDALIRANIKDMHDLCSVEMLDFEHFTYQVQRDDGTVEDKPLGIDR